jgi:WASH complex subunit 7
MPALSLSYIESITARKEKMSRKNIKTSKATEASIGFTDDGFTVGVAYILTVLDQFSAFDSLHWFESIREKIDRDQQEAIKDKKDQDDKLTQTTSLTLKRLQVMQREFDLLRFNLTSCKILFSS